MSQRTRKNESPTSGLILAALGIVFGDIGTSPLYAMQVVLGLSGGRPSHDDALGLLSLIVWALLIVVSLKYVTLVMRADNHGEGGILALMSLLKSGKTHHGLIVAIGLFGAALIYGDGAITPAISVLSAVEGIKVISPLIAPFVLPISIFILLTLFAIQYHGTARIGCFFGPIMCVWFLVLGALGIRGILQYPGVLVALNPWYAVNYLLASGWHDFVILGGIFLAVTGAEALYADMGHIGAKPIRFAAFRARCRRQYFLSLGAGVHADTNDCTGNHRHHYCQSGNHHRRVFHDTAGHSVGMVPTPCDYANIGRRLWTNICAIRQLVVDVCHAWFDNGVWQFRTPCRRLWHCGFVHYVADYNVDVRGYVSSVEMESCVVYCRCGNIFLHRCGVRQREYIKTFGRRLGAVNVGCRHLWVDDRMAQWCRSYDSANSEIGAPR
jgi:hypothetical protein